MDYYNKDVIEILRWGRIGAITCHIAKKLNIPPLEALKKFYRSVTCEKFHNPQTGLYLYSDLYIVDNFMAEIGMTK